jgi:hypothetical protein
VLDSAKINSNAEFLALGNIGNYISGTPYTKLPWQNFSAKSQLNQIYRLFFQVYQVI